MRIVVLWFPHDPHHTSRLTLTNVFLYHGLLTYDRPHHEAKLGLAATNNVQDNSSHPHRSYMVNVQLIHVHTKGASSSCLPYADSASLGLLAPPNVLHPGVTV